MHQLKRYYEKILPSFQKHRKALLLLSSFLITITFLTITLVLIQNPQDLRQRASESNCTLANPMILESEEKKFIDLLNQHRKSLGKSELRISGTLTKAAQWMAEDMAKSGVLSHTDSLGRITENRFYDCGVSQQVIAGENLAYAGDAENVMNAWLNSPTHKENMERSQYDQTGIAREKRGNIWYWANTFSSGNDGTTVDPEPTAAQEPTASPTPTNSQTPTNTPMPTNNPDPFPTTDPTKPTPSIPPENQETIKFSYKLVGIGSNTAIGENPNPLHTNWPTVVAIVDGSLNDHFSLEIANTRYTPTTSTFESEGIVDKQYLTSPNQILLYTWTALPELISITSLQEKNGIITIPTFTFTTGDVTFDLVLDLSDYSSMIGCIKDSSSCSIYLEFHDLNRDGKVDILDLNILMRAFDDQRSQGLLGNSEGISPSEELKKIMLEQLN